MPFSTDRLLKSQHRNPTSLLHPQLLHLAPRVAPAGFVRRGSSGATRLVNFSKPLVIQRGARGKFSLRVSFVRGVCVNWNQLYIALRERQSCGNGYQAKKLLQIARASLIQPRPRRKFGKRRWKLILFWSVIVYKMRPGVSLSIWSRSRTVITDYCVIFACLMLMTSASIMGDECDWTGR